MTKTDEMKDLTLLAIKKQTTFTNTTQIFWRLLITAMSITTILSNSIALNSRRCAL